MLKSHFNITGSEPEEEVINEEMATPNVEEEEDLWEMKGDGRKVEDKERKLNKSEVSVRLSWLGKTADGSGYTYLKAACTGMSLTHIDALKCFKHLQFVDVSNNLLTLEALQAVTELPFLLLLQADKNKLLSANLHKCKYLQVIIMNHNGLVSVEDVFQPELSTLEVGYNNIYEIKFTNRMPNIRVLDFRYNMIHDISELDFPKLDSLYLAGNKINNLIGIYRLKNLRVLHLRNNPIRFLNGFESELPKLQYLNLRNCKIGTLTQVKKLREQMALDVLILKGTPYMGGSGKEDPEIADEEEDPELRVEVLAALPRLQRINKTEVSPEERAEAQDLMTQWMEDGEKDEEEEVVEEAHEEEEQHNEEP